MKLEGLDVVTFEARHAKTLSDLIAIQGGTAFSAPSMKEVPLENNPEVFQFAEKWFRKKIDILILLTGVGTRTLVDILQTKYPKEEIMDAFRNTVLVPRGPKPIRVLKEWGIPFAFIVPEPNTWKELLKAMDENLDVRGKTVAVQEYGVPNPELIQGLEQRGAAVVPVPVYRWALPDDLEPMKRAVSRILDGKAHVAMFTTAVQVKHLLEVAGQMGNMPLKDALNKIVIASVGPDCSEALRSYGISVDIEPESPKMGPLVLAAAQKAQGIFDAKRARK